MLGNRDLAVSAVNDMADDEILDREPRASQPVARPRAFTLPRRRRAARSTWARCWSRSFLFAIGAVVFVRQEVLRLSPRPAILFSVLVAILLPFYLLVDRPEVKLAELQAQEESLLNLKSVDSITITRGDEKIRYEMTSDGEHYRLVDPQGKFVPQDLMQAVVSLLVTAKSVEVVSSDPNDLKEFGLDQPEGEIVVSTADRPQPINIFFGAENPTHTAIYARIEGIPKVFLLGKNLEYYQALMFEWVEGKQGKDA